MTIIKIRTFLYFYISLSLSVALTSCSQSNTPATPTDVPSHTVELSKEIVNLKAEIVKLKLENEKLKTTPKPLLADLDEKVKSGDVSASEGSLKILTEKYPSTQESTTGKKLLEALIENKKKEESEAKKIAALGFKALKSKPNFIYGVTSAKLNSTDISKTWVFDAYGNEWRYLESEKGEKFITAKLNIISKEKDPSLFGIGVYEADGAVLNKIGEMQYKFSRWDDYGSYLGNESDFRNDFAHSSNIPFSLGVSISDEKLKRPLYLVITKEGCHTRSYDRFGQPPVTYSSTACDTLKSNLTTDDFKENSLAILKRID